MDAAGKTLLLRDEEIKIQPKPLALLLHLIHNRERVVSKTELLEVLWPGISVSDLALWSALRDLRRALGDTNTARRMIRTVRGHGFRFVADVVSPERSAEPEATRPAETSGSSIEPGTPGTTATDFVDRDDAMATLRASLAAAARGDARVSFIAGPAGIGKTRLTTELAREAEREGFEAWTGRCFDREGATAFWPWLQIMRGLMAAERTADAAQQARAGLQELAWLTDPAQPSHPVERAHLDRAELRLRFFDAFGLFLQRVSAAQPLLLVIDDLHWADEASLLLLDFIVTALNGVRARIHLVGTFRDPPRPEHTLARVLATGARHAFTERIDLQGLRRDAVRHLIAIAAAKAPAPAVVEAVLSATAGNALFVSELAKLAGKGQLDVEEFGQGLPVPQRVRDVLRWQLDRLSPGCRSVLQLMCVVGSELELSVLVRAARESQRAVLEWLSEAEAVGLALAGRQGTMRFAFVHDLVRESIYRDLSIADRTRLHRQVAEALEGTTRSNPAAQLSQIAYHYALGAADGAADRAVHFCRMAGQRANARMAYEEAVVHYDRALRALPMLGEVDPKAACELLLAQAEAAWGTLEDAAAVQQRFVLAADAAREAGEPEMLARAALGRSGRGAGPGDFRDILVIDEVDIALLTEAEAALGSAETELRALVLARLALAVRYARPFAIAEQLSAEGVRIAEALAAQETLAEVLRYRHEVLSGPEFVHERVALAQRILTLARAVRSRPLEIDALTFQTRDHHELLDFAVASAAAVSVGALEATMKHPGALFRNGIRMVFVLTLRGKFEKAERYVRRFHERDIARNMDAQGTFDMQMAMLAMHRGDHAAAIEGFSTLCARKPNVACLELGIARELALSGRRAEAQEILEAVAQHDFSRVTQQHELATLGCYFLLAEVCVELADTRRAAELYQRMLPFADMMAAPFLAVVWQGSMAHALGLLAGFLRRWNEAERHFEKALAIAEALASPPLAAVSLQSRGAVLLQRGRAVDVERGRELVKQALEIAERIGMQVIASRGRELLSASRWRAAGYQRRGSRES